MGLCKTVSKLAHCFFSVKASSLFIRFWSRRVQRLNVHRKRAHQKLIRLFSGDWYVFSTSRDSIDELTETLAAGLWEVERQSTFKKDGRLRWLQLTWKFSFQWAWHWKHDYWEATMLPIIDFHNKIFQNIQRRAAYWYTCTCIHVCWQMIEYESGLGLVCVILRYAI